MQTITEEMNDTDYTWNLMQLYRVKTGEYMQIDKDAIVSFLSDNYCKDVESDKFEENWGEVRLLLCRLYKKAQEEESEKILELIEKSKEGLKRLKSIYKTSECINYLNSLLD